MAMLVESPRGNASRFWNPDLVWLLELGSRSVSRWFSSNGVSSRTFRRRGAGRAHGWGRSCPGDGKRLCCTLGAPRLCTLSLWPSLSLTVSLCARSSSSSSSFRVPFWIPVVFCLVACATWRFSSPAVLVVADVR
jgi:hypothetical protein